MGPIKALFLSSSKLKIMKLREILLILFTIAVAIEGYLFVANKMFKHFDFILFISLSMFFILLDINVNEETKNNFGG